MEHVTTPAAPDALFDRMVSLRRHFHQHPELAYEEVDTARTIMAELERLGIPYDYGGVGGGVVGRVTGHDAGPTIALRAEMDALACTERTGLSFASDVPDRMHACGHDAHMAMLLGGAALLKASPPPGTVLLVFQPAEEAGNGASTMVRSRMLDGADAIFACHVTDHYRVGEIMVSEGKITAQANRFTIRVRGRAGHGARPHEGVDAVIVASLLITAIQTLVSRETNPLHPSVITVGSVRAGSAHNVIAEDAVLEGTVRTTRPESQSHIIDGLRRMVAAVADLHSAEVTIDFTEQCPPVVNAVHQTTLARRAAGYVVGDESVVEQEYPSMGAEDFSFYLEEIPGCYVRLGTRGPDAEYVPLHSPLFTVDERVLSIGAAYFDRVAREAIGEKS